MSVTSHSLQPCHAFHSTLSTLFTLDELDLNCSFFALYTFPQSIIIDQYELLDRRLAFEFWGESNLELPVFALNQSIPSLLLVNATPSDARRQVAVHIPVHARYGEPSTTRTTLQSITIPAPMCFWGCPPSAVAPSAFSSDPPVEHSTMLGSLKHFSVPDASSYHALLQVPVPSKDNLSAVEIGTTFVVFVAFLWLVRCSWRAAATFQSYHLKQQ